MVAAAPPRSKSLAQFDSATRNARSGRRDARPGDQVYASLYRLKLDDALRAELEATRKSALYERAPPRAQTLTKNAAASDVKQRLDQQCQALKREIKGERRRM